MFSTKHIPGLTLSVGLAALAFLVTYIFDIGGIEVLALLLGFGLANSLKLNERFQAGIKFSEKQVLSWAIALMGLQLSFSKLNLSIWLIPILLLAMAVAILLGNRLAKRFGVFDTCGYMMGVGTAICGASAIAAVSPFLKGKAHETGVAVGVINVLGTIGMLLLPLLAISFGFSAQESGVLMGGSLQAVGQAVGAGYAMSDEVGEVATLVKLGRVLMLGPVIIFTALLMHTKSDGIERKKVLPGFILVFLLLLIVANVFSLPVELQQTAKYVDKALLSVAMVGIGLQIKLKDLIKQGPKALLLGSVIFVVQISLMLAFIYGQRLLS